jgi:hypothetical protein
VPENRTSIASLWRAPCPSRLASPCDVEGERDDARRHSEALRVLLGRDEVEDLARPNKEARKIPVPFDLRSCPAGGDAERVDQQPVLLGRGREAIPGWRRPASSASRNYGPFCFQSTLWSTFW